MATKFNNNMNIRRYIGLFLSLFIISIGLLLFLPLITIVIIVGLPGFRRLENWLLVL